MKSEARPIGLVELFLSVLLLPALVTWYVKWISESVRIGLWIAAFLVLLRAVFLLWGRSSPKRFEGTLSATLFLVMATAYVTGAIDGHVLSNIEKGLLFPPRGSLRYETTEFSVDATINDLGIRDYEYDITPGESYRICAIGDSFTFGWGVDIDSTWIKRVERRLLAQGRDIQFWNLGKPGIGTHSYVRITRSAVRDFHCRLIVIGLLQGNDLKQIVEESEGRTGASAESPSILAYLVRTIYPNLSWIVANFSRQVHLQDVWREQFRQLRERWSPSELERFERLDPTVKEAAEEGLLNPGVIQRDVSQPYLFVWLGDTSKPEIKRGLEQMVEDLSRLQRSAAECGSQVLIFSIPGGAYVSDRQVSNLRSKHRMQVPEDFVATNDMNALMADVASKAAIPYHAFNRDFTDRSGDEGLFFPMDGHFNERGHAVAAELIEPVIAAAIDASGSTEFVCPEVDRTSSSFSN